MSSAILSLSIAELGAAYRRRELSPVEVTKACLASIDQTESEIHAWVEISADNALKAASVAEAALTRGDDLGPLHGVPTGIKDIFNVAGLPTRCGSPARAQDAAVTSDSASVAALRAGGAVLLGKTVTQEFAAGVISPPARNPWDPARIPGGSSGGSAAALAASNCFAAMGSDTGGSIRIPAAACGVVGFKPSYASLSADGVFPLSWSLDTVGPLAKSVADARTIWSLLAAREAAPLDTTDLQGFRIGLAGPFFMDHIQPAVRDAVTSTIETFRSLGAEIVETAWHDAAAARAIGFLINRAETATVHESLARAEPERFAQYNADLRLRVAAGGILPTELYVNSLRKRAAVRDSMATLFRENRLSALLAPTLPTTALPAADMTVTGTNLDEGIGAAWTRLTMPFNTTGQPVLAMPAGFDAVGLPIGVQFAGAPGREEELFAIGHVLESALGVQSKRPAILDRDQEEEVQS